MEDGPETAEGSYKFGEKTYRLEEAARAVWSVYDGERYLGIVAVAETAADDHGPQYVARPSGEENVTDFESTDDWRAALEHLIESTAE